MKERVLGSLEGIAEYENLTTEDIDKLIIEFKRMSDKINE